MPRVLHYICPKQIGNLTVKFYHCKLRICIFAFLTALSKQPRTSITSARQFVCKRIVNYRNNVQINICIYILFLPNIKTRINLNFISKNINIQISIESVNQRNVNFCISNIFQVCIDINKTIAF